MKLSLALAFVAVALFTGGCATPPQKPIALSPTMANAESGRIGVGMTALPKVETHLPGASCLLCIIAASIANSGIADLAGTLPYEDLPNLKNEVAELLRKKGVDAMVITENLDVGALSNFSSDEPNFARKDFLPLGKKYNIDRILVIEIRALGFIRNYSAYFPTSDPKSLLDGVGYVVNLKNNSYDWYLPVLISKSADKNWDEPPEYPGLTNAYFQALAIGRDAFLLPFASDPVLTQPSAAERPAVPVSANALPAQGAKK